MANKEKLPWVLVEEILTRVPPTSLVRLKAVCKRWNTLFNDKTFIKNHKKTFQFVLTTRSKIYSVSVSPKLEVSVLTIDTPGRLKSQILVRLVDSSGFLLCGMDKGAVVWNPWLSQTRCIEPEVNTPLHLNFLGIGYDNNRRVDEIVYKTLLVYNMDSDSTWKIHEFASDAWKDEEQEKAKYTTSTTSSSTTRGFIRVMYHFSGVVSLNGTFEEFSPFCDLPCGKNHLRDALVLRVFREDQFSLLKQCYVTKKVEVWVTTNKIDDQYGRDVKWTSFMEVSIPNMPDLVEIKSYAQPSYFLDDDKRLVICSCDETGRAWIYVVGENKLISKVQLDSVVDPWPFHCTYFPSLVQIPGGKREAAESRIKLPYMDEEVILSL
ncbi:putative F-box/kelch-repeat protein At1g32430 [Capsella rubella]|uniref:putative F-box/kelch-repeat protein At1g32430 n=1 Tax=Capsella rubella TaxID=81985 RepID=UPI000CD50EAD|nr:putative F-box/kelch-repeat protein At1g32430 [Capsella rubella]